MVACGTKEELVSRYIDKLELDGMNRDNAKIFAADSVSYVPHLYRGGFVIRGFGFSVERIGKFVDLDRSGNPSLV